MLSLFRQTRSSVGQAFQPREKPLTMAERAELYKRSVREHVYDSVVVALAGRLASVDGVINMHELEAMGRVFPLGTSTRENLRMLMLQSAGDSVPLTEYVRRLNTFFPSNQRLYRDTVQGMFTLAESDSVINIDEIQFLKQVVQAFGLPDSYFLTQVKDVIMPKAGTHYQILGVGRMVNESELKAAYHRSVRMFHPDKLAFLPNADGLVAIANARMKVLQHAYTAIKQQKKYK